MALVVFLKGVNVGGHRTFRPTVVARKLGKYGAVNVGATGTFVFAKPVSRSRLRDDVRRCLPFEAQMMICSAQEILDLAAGEPFAGEPSGTGIVRFVSVLARRPRRLPELPLNLPPGDGWLVRLVNVQDRFAFGVYRRAMRTIGILGQLEKHLGGPLTTRNWNTITLLAEMLSFDGKS